MKRTNADEALHIIKVRRLTPEELVEVRDAIDTELFYMRRETPPSSCSHDEYGFSEGR